MRNETLDKLIFLNKQITSILSKLYVIEEEANFYRVTKNLELFKIQKHIIKEKYNEILNIQLQSMELPYDKENKKIMFYRNLIFSVSEQRRNRDIISSNIYPIISATFYSSTNLSNTLSRKEHLKIILNAHFTSIVDVRFKNEDIELQNFDDKTELKSFLDQNEYKIKYSLFHFTNSTYINVNSTNEIITYLSNQIINDENVYIQSEDDETIIGTVLACYLIKNQVVDVSDIFGYINYLRSLSRQNEKELIFDETQTKFIIKYAKSLK
jgi:hypothetical protein